MSVKTLTLNVDGMHCQSCAVAVKTVLRMTKGVKDARVELNAKKVMVSYDPRHVNEATVRRTVSNSGFKVQFLKR